MPNPNLNDLLKQWSDAEATNDVATDCPPISVLWSHPSAPGGPLLHPSVPTSLRPYVPASLLPPLQPPTPLDTDHIATCPRCQKRLAIIRTELAKATTAPSTLPFPTRTRRTTGALALAASIALVFVLWPSAERGPLERQVALFGSYAFPVDDGTVTRGGDTSTGEHSQDAPDWVIDLLADEQVQAAIADQYSVLGMILSELRSGRLMLDPDGQLIVAPNIDDATARTEGLADLVAQDRDATERIVDAFVQVIPEASEKDRTALRQALNRWRAKKVFGIHEKEEAQ